jgi:hypothetical protein
MDSEFKRGLDWSGLLTFGLVAVYYIFCLPFPEQFLIFRK